MKNVTADAFVCFKYYFNDKRIFSCNLFKNVCIYKIFNVYDNSIRIIIVLCHIVVYKKPGQTPGQGQNIHNCYYNQPPSPGQVCFVDVKMLGPCTEENFFMYDRASPCIILKLNKVYYLI